MGIVIEDFNENFSFTDKEEIFSFIKNDRILYYTIGRLELNNEYFANVEAIGGNISLYVYTGKIKMVCQLDLNLFEKVTPAKTS